MRPRRHPPPPVQTKMPPHSGRLKQFALIKAPNSAPHPTPPTPRFGFGSVWGPLSRATPLSSIGHALLLALMHWVCFSLGWTTTPPPHTHTHTPPRRTCSSASACAASRCSAEGSRRMTPASPSTRSGSTTPPAPPPWPPAPADSASSSGALRGGCVCGVGWGGGCWARSGWGITHATRVCGCRTWARVCVWKSWSPRFQPSAYNLPPAAGPGAAAAARQGARRAAPPLAASSSSALLGRLLLGSQDV